MAPSELTVCYQKIDKFHPKKKTKNVKNIHKVEEI